MDAFEVLVASVLQAKGYWVRTNVKVDLTAKEKGRIGRPSSPRWDIDVVAYKGSLNEVLVVECKSYLDSRGVVAANVEGSGPSNRYKLFNDHVLRRVVLRALAKQLVREGACGHEPSVTMCLAAGRIASSTERLKLAKLFTRRHWKLFDEEWLLEALKEMASRGYENQVASIVSKLLVREHERTLQRATGVTT